MRINHLAISILFIFTLSFLRGIDPVVKLPEAELFTIENGLSQTRVNLSFSDSYGYLWVGTSNGLNLYDGYRFQIFKHVPYDTTSLSHNFIRCIAEDEKSNLWIGTDYGLNYYNRSTGRFKQYLHNQDDSLSISGHQILSVYPDRKGFIWIKTARHLERLDPVTDSIIKYRHYVNSFNNNPGMLNCPIVEDKNGFLWFGSNDGLFSFDRDSNSFTHFFHKADNLESISNNEILSIYEDKNGELWVGTKNGLNKFDRIRKTFRRYLFSPLSSLNPSPNAINSIIEDPQGVFWIGSNRGLILFDKRKPAPVNQTSLFINKSLFSLGTISNLLIDKSGIIWISGFQGLFKIDTKPKKFNIYNSSFNSFPSLSGDMITSIYKEAEDLLWLGVWDNGLNILNRKTGEVDWYYPSNTNIKKRIASNKINCIMEDHSGKIWLGSTNGIDIFDRATRSFISFQEKYPSVSSRILNNRMINCLIEDNNGDVWIGTDKGVLRFQRKFEQITSYNKIYRNKLIVDIGFVYALAHDKDNLIWIGTENGLNCYNQNKDFFYRYTETGRKMDLSSRIVYSLHVDKHNTLWVGTASGLNRYNPEEENFDVFTEENGLPNDLINGILEDDNNCLWLSTNKGLSKYDIDKNEFSNYDITEGLQSYEFNYGAFAKADDGEMFFGGISGFNSFYPDNLPKNPYNPRIVFTSFELIDNNGSKNTYSNGNNDIKKVDINQSFIVRFAALDFTLPTSNIFEYSIQLKGNQERWIPIGNQNSVTFSNLPPGNYLLQIRGSNSDHVWSKFKAELEIVSTAPFWRTKFALYFFLLLMVLATYFLIQYRTQSLRKSNRILRDRDIAAKEISRQKDMLSLRNKNIEDSLNYAQRIQKAMLTTPKQFRTILPNSFILHKPKDIVSGDFYWISEQDDKIFVAAADCTGHGVPGAFMSLISFELFRKIIKTQKIYRPDLILNTINSNFEEIFGNIEDIAIRDGMDLSFCVLDKSMKGLEFSGAFNPLYIVRDSKLIELKSDHFSIGADFGSDSAPKIFTNHTISLQEGDMIYMFSDGYADQFGGPEGKKYKYRRFRHLLLNIHQLPLDKQRTIVDENIEEWRGNTEQIDDILIIGIRI